LKFALRFSFARTRESVKREIKNEKERQTKTEKKKRKKSAEFVRRAWQDIASFHKTNVCETLIKN
jgi:hypothetical protein